MIIDILEIIVFGFGVYAVARHEYYKHKWKSVGKDLENLSKFVDTLTKDHEEQ